MSAFIIITGLLLGTGIFIYLMSSYHTVSDKISEKKNGTGPDRKEDLRGSDKIIVNNHILKRNPGERICPLCAHLLTRDEPLYASHIQSTSGEKILIHGCRFCYKPDRNQD